MMTRAICIVLILLLVLVVWLTAGGSNEYYVMSPNGTLKYNIDASFLNDRAWFDNNEKNFYSRYTTPHT